MRIGWIVAASFVMSALTWGHGAEAQNGPAAPGAAQPPANTTAPVVAEQADRLLKQMGAYVGSAEQFTFHADITFDHVLPSGQKLQYSAAEDVALQRPGGLYVEWSSDLGDRQFWCDGKSITLYDPATPFYASEAVPPEIDAMLDKVVADLSFSPPLVDFLYRDPYQAMRGNMGRYRASTDPVQISHHLQDTTLTAPIQRGVHRLEFCAPNCRARVHAGTTPRA